MVGLVGTDGRETRHRGGAFLGLRDVGDVQLGAQDYSSFTYWNGKEAAFIIVYLAPGATVTIELPASESIFFVGVSDDGVIRGTGSSDRVASGSDATADPNLMTAVPVGGDKDHKFTQFLTLKALHHLEPQPLLVLANTIDPVTKALVWQYGVVGRPGVYSQVWNSAPSR